MNCFYIKLCQNIIRGSVLFIIKGFVLLKKETQYEMLLKQPRFPFLFPFGDCIKYLNMNVA